ncbi:MAG: enolase C-terminal domain-like protein [Trueperaceae bacterium]
MKHSLSHASSTIQGAEARLLPSRLTHGLRLKNMEISGDRGLPVVRLVAGEAAGYGESPPLPSFTGQGGEEILLELRECLPLLLGLQSEEALEWLHSPGFGSWSAPTRCAVDLALHDLMARGAGVPLHVLLGGEAAPGVRITRAIGFHELDKTVELAEGYRAQGVKALKLKVGREPLLDAEVIKAVRRVVGADVEISMDANESLDVDSALQLVEASRDAGIAYFEQPVARDDHAGLRKVREAGVRVLVDESMFTVDDARRLAEAKAADLFAIKLIKCGGLAPALEIARFANEHEFPLIVIDPLGSAVSLNAGLHLAAILPDRGYAHGLSAGLDVDAPHAPHLPLEHGFLNLPTSAGSGARVTWPIRLDRERRTA